MFNLRRLWGRYHLIVWLSVLLIVGFFATSLSSYWVSRDLIRHNLVDQSLPLTGDNIYSEIQRDILRPTFISSLMANDTFLRDWMLAGEQDHEAITRYLNEVKQQYGTITSFLVSDATRNYYYADGLLKKVAADEPRDLWYFRVRDMTEPYEMNVDVDMANRDTITIFINYRVLDYQGDFIGVTGVGLTLDTLARMINSVQERFQRNIYFVDINGDVVVAGKGTNISEGSIYNLPGISTIATSILNQQTEPTQLSYQLKNRRIIVSSRYLPELHWYLVVEQEEARELAPLHDVFILNKAMSAAITALVLMIVLYAVIRSQRRLEGVAATDSLTGLLNRQAFEFLFEQAIHEAARSKNPVCVLLLDIDHFKKINDTYGHVVGDQVICAVSGVIQKVLRQNDIMSRWGGEEFLILLKDCSQLDAYELAQKILARVARNSWVSDAPDLQVTVSVGVTQYQTHETLMEVFARVDEALYRAKNSGRNAVAQV